MPAQRAVVGQVAFDLACASGLALVCPLFLAWPLPLSGLELLNCICVPPHEL